MQQKLLLNASNLPVTSGGASSALHASGRRRLCRCGVLQPLPNANDIIIIIIITATVAESANKKVQVC